MGSLISKPKAPARVQTIIQQAPVSASLTEPERTDTQTPSPSDSSPSNARVDNLLRRNRGRFGTILTGFRGVLDSNPGQGQRKTLLGE